MAVAGLAGGSVGCSSDSNSKGKLPPAGGAGGGVAGSGERRWSAGSAGGAAGSAAGGAAGGVVLTAKQARGEYLVDAVDACGDCHTPQTATGPDLTHYLAGNPTFIQLPNGDALPTRNLTNDATGLMNRTDAEIKDMFQNGMRPTATGSEPLNPTMPYYVFHNMDADDADAIVAYLRTVPGVNNTIPRRAASFDVPAPAPPLDVTKLPAPPPATRTWEARCAGGTWRPGGHLRRVPHEAPRPRGGDRPGRGPLLRGRRGLLVAVRGHPHDPPGVEEPDLRQRDGARDLGGLRHPERSHAGQGQGRQRHLPADARRAEGGVRAARTDGDVMDIANYIKSLPPVTNTIVDMCVCRRGRLRTAAPRGDGGGGGLRRRRAGSALATAALPAAQLRERARASLRQQRRAGTAGGGGQ